MRLDKYLAETAQCTRSEAKTLLSRGRVTVNGAVCKKGDTQLREGDSVAVDGAPLAYQQFVYLMLNKPVGIVCTTDPRERYNVVSYLNYPIRVFPVGRLDRESEGLLLLTSDGEIVNRLLRAVGGHEREYEVTVDRPVTREFVESMQAGVPILDTVTLPCRVRRTGERSFNIVLVQGLNRQIRRMCEALGYRVTRLRRVRIMHIRLGDLRPGQWRELTQKELDGLEKAGIYRKTFS